MNEKKAVGRKPTKSKSAKKTESSAIKKNPQGDVIFALDIGTRTVVGVLARKTPQGCKILDMETVVHEKRSMADGQIEDIKSVSGDIKKVKRALEARNRIQLRDVCVAAAGRALRTVRASWEYSLPESKMITVEILQTAELDAVRRTCDSFSQSNDAAAFYCVGHNVISLSLDGFKVNKPEGHRGEKLVTEIIAAFLPAYVVESLCAAVYGANLEVANITLEPIAAMNAVIPQELRLINIALCDIGAGTSDVAVSRDGSVVAYGMATTAGDEITETIMKELLVDFNTAEMLKTSDDKEVAFKDILLRENKVTRERIDSIIAPAARELARVIAEEIINANAVPPQAIFLVGGGSKLKNLAALVAEELKVEASHVITGRRELLRGIIAPDEMPLDAEHSTPLGIAVSAGEGVSYDFTTITVNGKKLHALDTNRLTVFELMGFAKLKPEDMIAGAGKPLSFTLSGEKITLRGEHPKPSEIIVNDEPASMNTVVTKGDVVTIAPAVNGADAAAHLSDYFDLNTIRAFTVVLFGNKQRAGKYILINGREVTADRRIWEGDEIALVQTESISELLSYLGIEEKVLLNGMPPAPEDMLKSGDIIAYENPPVVETAQTVQTVEAVEKTLITVPEAPVEHNGPMITVNGIETEFPARGDGKPPIFLDVAAAFSDDPTELLAHAGTITVNGKIARLDEEIHDGDVIIIE
ncbi:MAG: cell division protein FtsA [Ruminococcaceae bacterium]|nr:cell division protein FtsA [Oscillospiraceae bacterium]